MTEGPDAERLAAAEGRLLPQILELALARTGAEIGALFLWNAAEKGLVLAHQVALGLTVTMPNMILRRGSARPGLALHVFESNKSHLCADTALDPHYTRYLLEIGSMVAAPIRYQKRAIGVLTVSARETDRFSKADLAALEDLAQESAKFLRRAELDKQSRERTGRPFLIKGLSPEWLEVERRLEQAAPTSAPVLIRGESGSGKDLVANAIHFNSLRSQNPLVTVNCAAIPETLLESILFGHVKGAFTGATVNKIGEFQKADGGSLFLDEVGELPIMLQAKVLRAVEQGEVQPLGSNRAPEHVDVRLICATNRDLEGMSRRGEFREDLYYRLSVMTLDLPPLRSYKDNLEVLSAVFLQQASERHDKHLPRFSPDALAALLAYDYPGNVRELKNAIEHAVIMCTGDEVQTSDLPRPFHGTRVSTPSKRARARSLKQMREEWLHPLERRYLTELLNDCRGNVRSAADKAGINPVTLYRLLRKRGIAIQRQASDSDN